MDSPAVINAINSLFNWVLSLGALGLAGILAIYRQLWIVSTKLDEHEKNCLVKHQGHEKNQDALWQEMRDIRHERH